MRIDTLSTKEAQFNNTLVDNSGRSFHLIETVDLGGVAMKRLTPPATGFFYKEKTKKDMIVVHSTIGVLMGDISTLTRDNNPISVSYLIGRNGVVYEIFSPEYWSYHLGQGSISGNKVNSSRSIGIELTNLGPLRNVNGNLETIYSRQQVKDANGNIKITAPDVYCTVDHVNEYTKLNVPFRGETYFCAYTNAQYKALNKLIRHLCSTYGIEMNFAGHSNIFTEPQAASFKGICSHVNYRPSGKWDVGPDFKWDLVINETDVAPVIPAVANTPSTGLPPFLPDLQQPAPQQPTPTSMFKSFLSRFL